MNKFPIPSFCLCANHSAIIAFNLFLNGLQRLIKFFFVSSACFLLFLVKANAYNHQTDSLLTELQNPLADTTRLKTYAKLLKCDDISHDSAILHVQQLMHFATNQPSDSIYTMAVQDAYGYYLNKIGDREAAQKICWKLLEVSEQNNYVFGMASACKYLGVIYLL